MSFVGRNRGSPTRKNTRPAHRGDALFRLLVGGVAFLLPAVLVLIVVYLARAAMPAIHRFGINFLTQSVWDPVQESFGALPVIYGTLVSSFLAILISTPISVGVALLLNEVLNKRVATVIGFFIEMLAAIPSVVYGLWGIFVLAPWLRLSVEPFLARYLGFLPLFEGPPYGVGMLAAGLILSIMIIPTISSISKEVFKAIPTDRREAALALGATHWEVMRVVVLKAGKSGIFGAVILGLGRALGETMAVTMVIGNRAQISPSLFDPSQTMASVLANEYAEASGDMHLAALIEVGLVLFAVTFVINFFARMIVLRKGLGGKSQ